MAKYWIYPNEYDNQLVSLTELEDYDPEVMAGGVEVPWWLEAKHEMVRRDIKNLNAELLARKARKDQEEVPW